jgi:hypothetical protein
MANVVKQSVVVRPLYIPQRTIDKPMTARDTTEVYTTDGRATGDSKRYESYRLRDNLVHKIGAALDGIESKSWFLIIEAYGECVNSMTADNNHFTASSLKPIAELKD